MYLIVDERKNGGKYVIKMSELIKKALSLFCWSVLFVWKDYIAPQCTYKRMQRRIQNCCNIQDGALCDNGFQPLTIITKCSILDVEAVLDPPQLTLTFRIQLQYNDSRLASFWKHSFDFLKLVTANTGILQRHSF